jgi:hypothetical protein
VPVRRRSGHLSCGDHPNNEDNQSYCPNPTFETRSWGRHGVPYFPARSTEVRLSRDPDLCSLYVQSAAGVDQRLCCEAEISRMITSKRNFYKHRMGEGHKAVFLAVNDKSCLDAIWNGIQTHLFLMLP